MKTCSKSITKSTNMPQTLLIHANTLSQAERLKSARSVPHGGNDRQQPSLETKSTAASLKLFLLCISITTLLMPLQTAIGALEQTDKNRIPVIKHCIKKADVHAHNKDNHTPLNIATQYNNKKAMNLLYSHGAHRNLRNEAGTTAHDNKKGSSPLHPAAEKGQKEIVELLITAGADTAFEDGVTPLHSAAAHGRKEVVDRLLTQSHKDTLNKNGWTSLHFASQNGHDGKTALICSLVALLKKSQAEIYLKVIYILLGECIFKKAHNFSLKDQNRLKALGFDRSTFDTNRKKSKILLKKHCQTSICYFENCGIPKVITQLIIEYHTCFDTQMLLFTKAEISSHKPSCIVQ